MILFGIGVALVIAPLTKSALSVEPQFSGSASGVNNAVARTAALMSVAVLGAIIISTFPARLNESISTSSLTQEEQKQVLSQSDKLGGIIISDTFDKTSHRLARNVIRESLVYGFRWVMAVSAALAFIGGLVLFFTIHRTHRQRTLRSNK